MKKRKSRKPEQYLEVTRLTDHTDTNTNLVTPLYKSYCLIHNYYNGHFEDTRETTIETKAL